VGYTAQWQYFSSEPSKHSSFLSHQCSLRTDCFWFSQGRYLSSFDSAMSPVRSIGCAYHLILKETKRPTAVQLILSSRTVLLIVTVALQLDAHTLASGTQCGVRVTDELPPAGLTPDNSTWQRYTDHSLSFLLHPASSRFEPSLQSSSTPSHRFLAGMQRPLFTQANSFLAQLAEFNFKQFRS